MTETSTLRIANCSGFFGDRLAAAKEMVEGGEIDVLTGDWLAELTMGVLAKQRNRAPDAGYAKTFVQQVEQVLGTCLDRGIKIISNAGGLNPSACAAAITEIAERQGRTVRVALVKGDEATQVFANAREQGWDAPHLDSGQLFSEVRRDPYTVNAYLGGWGIKEALDAGADVVITGRVTDAAIIVGPSAWHFGWERDDWDALAGAVVAGHVIECGAQATGGNFSFFSDLHGMQHVGFPIASIANDGSSVIEKHTGTGGAVTVETVTAQLLYEIDGPRYANPDVVSRLDSVRLEQLGADRVRISGVRGEPAPDSVKVGALISGGWRNEITFVITGSHVEEKAQLAEAALWDAVPGGKSAFEVVNVRLLRADRLNPTSMLESVSLLTIAVADSERERVNQFPRAAIETGLSSYPGLYFTAPPSPASEITVFWPTLMPAADFAQIVTLDGQFVTTVPSGPTARTRLADLPTFQSVDAPLDGPTVLRPLGTIFGARSGDKAGNATLGLWARSDASHAWLRTRWTEATIRELVPEASGCDLRVWELPNLRACGVTIVGLLGRGVAANLDLDSQGKGLAEYVRAKFMDIPAALFDGDGVADDFTLEREAV